jgi:hypothetical protein
MPCRPVQFFDPTGTRGCPSAFGPQRHWQFSNPREGLRDEAKPKRCAKRFTLSERRGGDTHAQHLQRPGCRPPLPCWNCGREFKHELFTFLTTSDSVVKHAKAMPVLLLTDAGVET